MLLLFLNKINMFHIKHISPFQHNLIFQVSPRNVDISKVSVSHHVAELSRDSFSDVMNAKDNQWQLFPCGYITIGTSWMPFKLMPENHELILKDMVHGVPIVYTKDRHNSFPIVKSLSVPDAAQVKKGLRYVISYYGYDIEDCVSHAYMHLKAANKLNTGDTYTVCLQFPIQLDYHKVQSVLEENIKITMVIMLPCCIMEFQTRPAKL